MAVKPSAGGAEGAEDDRLGPPRSVRGWAAAASLGLALVGLSIIPRAIADLDHLDLIDKDAFGTGALTTREYDDSLDQVSSAGRLYLGAYLVAGILFIGFFHAAYTNLARFGARGLRFKFSQAIWPWFLPIFNLIRPKQVANDIWRGSYSLDPAQPSAWSDAQVSPAVHWWWGLYLIAGLGIQFTARAFNASAPASEGERLALQAELLFLGLALIALGLAIAFIYQVAKQQESLLGN